MTLAPVAIAALNHRLRIIAERLEARRYASREIAWAIEGQLYANRWGPWLRGETERAFPSEVTREAANGP